MRHFSLINYAFSAMFACLTLAAWSLAVGVWWADEVSVLLAVMLDLMLLAVSIGTGAFSRFTWLEARDP